jgi:hypothetical protein
LPRFSDHDSRNGKETTMPAQNEIARLKRVIDELAEAIAADARRPVMSTSERRALRSEIETSIRSLDELRTRLSG